MFNQRQARSIGVTLLLALLVAVVGCGSGSVGGTSQQADPVVIDIPIAYVKRPFPNEENDGVVAIAEQDLREPAAFNPGAELFIRDRASSRVEEVNIIGELFVDLENGDEAVPLYDVKDLSVSDDGTKLLFALRAPEIENADDDEQPSWNIWEYDHTTAELRRIIASDIKAEAGQDVAPHYLRDGRIAFSSTRQRDAKAILLDEGKPQYAGLDEDRRQEAFVLHVMEDDGENIQQLTFNQSHDLDPVALPNGRILFTRWDNSAGGPGAISLYSINPDGSQLSFVYGYDSHNTGSDADEEVQFSKPQVLPDGQVLVRLQSFNNIKWGGNFARIDIENFSEHDQPIWQNILAAGSDDSVMDGDELVVGDGQQLLFESVRTDDQDSPGGRYSAVYPLDDGTGRMLVAWSQCRMWLLDENGIDLELIANGQAPEQDYDYQICNETLENNPQAVEATPRYGLWMFDPRDDTQRPILSAQLDVIYSELVALESHDIPQQSDSEELDFELAQQGVGILNIRTTYDVDGEDFFLPDIATESNPLLTPVSQRRARFIRIVKAVSRPDRDLVDFGNIPFNANRPMREILGYAPLEPDGSVKIRVPANVAFTFDLLDAQGQRVSGARHVNWLQLQGGEEMRCVGCHDSNSSVPHGRLDSQPESAYAGAAGGTAFAGSDENKIPFAGETMAETYWRLQADAQAENNNIDLPGLNVNLFFEERWGSDHSSDVDIQYADYIDPNNPDNPLPAPSTDACMDSWNASCRIVINYEQHILPLWRKERVLLDDMDVVLADNTCIRCHGIRDENDNLKVADAQLNLSDDPVDDNASYQDLLNTDNEQIIIDGALLDREELVIDPLTGMPLCQTDPDTGEEIRDELTGECTEFVTRTFAVRSPMSANGAAASSRFFTVFVNGPGATGAVDHQTMLSAGELKLLSEWLDIGAQYYNNPFDISAE